MTPLKHLAVKQCHADPKLDWLRALLGAPDKAPAVALSADQLDACIGEGLAPLLARKLDDGYAIFQHEARQLAMRELAHEQALQRLAAACLQASLDVLVIKGEALARTLHTQPCTRTRTDIDLWVHRSQLPRLRGILQALGYPTIVAIEQQWARFEVVHGQAHPPSVAFDVHVHPFFRPRMLQQRPFEAVWQDARALPGMEPLRAPAALDALLIAALHLAKNPHKRWIWLYDIDRLCVLNPQAVTQSCALAPSWGIASLVTDALCRSVAVFATQLPCALPQPLGDESLASMLDAPHKLTALRRDIALLPGWRERVGFLRELFFRPR
ncbi:MAG: nucleotidyltransferase family protein [Pseudomonadota bacterium]|nr:nucleotidyltransferase family protein [Pseudomonadota bacterium]